MTKEKTSLSFLVILSAFKCFYGLHITLDRYLLTSYASYAT